MVFHVFVSQEIRRELYLIMCYVIFVREDVGVEKIGEVT